MNMSLSKHELLDFVIAQLKIFFSENNKIAKEELGTHLDFILQCVEYCFSKINNKYFKECGNVFFNHSHTDQYAMFLYFAANTLRNKKRIRYYAQKSAN